MMSTLRDLCFSGKLDRKSVSRTVRAYLYIILETWKVEEHGLISWISSNLIKAAEAQGMRR